MSLIEDISSLPNDQIEDIEKLTLRWIFQAVLDFGMSAYEIFLLSPDDVKDVAEDITRELLDRLPGYNIQQRIFGTVDYKRARYIILPNQLVRQALFVDSKAEKENRTATLQMSQTSMRVRHFRAGVEVDEPGRLPAISIYNNNQYLTTTAFLHFRYEDLNGAHYFERSHYLLFTKRHSPGQVQSHHRRYNMVSWQKCSNARRRFPRSIVIRQP